MGNPGEVSQLLVAMKAGDRDAEFRLILLNYEELHRLAAVCMHRERAITRCSRRRWSTKPISA